MRASAANRKYLQSIVDQIKPIPRVLAAQTAGRIYSALIEETHFDSGQAALNWHMEPYVGTPVYEQQKLLWGYGDVAPIYPAGYKWSGGENEELVKTNLIENAYIAAIILENQKFDGITVYNPITPGFAGFTPGKDDNYEYFALSDAEAQMGAIVTKAIKAAEMEVARRYPFMKVV